MVKFFFESKLCKLIDVDLSYFIKCFLVGSRISIYLVFDMKDFFRLQRFFSKDNVDYILILISFGSFVIERVFVCFLDEVEFVCLLFDVISYFLWIGCYFVVFQLCQKNVELILFFRKMDKFMDKYKFVEFVVYCGFFDIDFILENNKELYNLLFFFCIEGYKNGGRVLDLEDKLGYKNKNRVVNYFEIILCQRGYGVCLQKLYNGIKELKKDFLVLMLVVDIMKNVFELYIRGFINDENIQNNLKFFFILLVKMDVF